MALATKTNSAAASSLPPVVRTYTVSASGDDTETGGSSGVQLDLGESAEVAVTFRGVSSGAEDDGTILGVVAGGDLPSGVLKLLD